MTLRGVCARAAGARRVTTLACSAATFLGILCAEARLLNDAISPPIAWPPRRVVLVTEGGEPAAELTRILSGLGCERVERAREREEALRRCARLVPELVLIDLQLTAAMTIARALAPGPAPICFVCDAQTDLPDDAAVFGIGVVERPINARRFARSVRFALQRRAATASSDSSQAKRRETNSPAADGGKDSSLPEPTKSGDFHDELLASMAHELRAPLQGVVGFARFLVEGRVGAVNETQRSYLEHIGRGADHALQVIDDVLDLTAVEADSLYVRTEIVDAERASREVLQVLQVIAIRKQIALAVEIDDRLGHVVSDATKIKQILYNFVSNALKFTPAGGRVQVRLLRRDLDRFSLDVEDSGPGIDSELLACLFERSPARARLSQGLGLVVTRRIAEALGGSVSAHNRPAGGCVFSAQLPIAPSVTECDPSYPLPPNGP
jgi:signal transduction histidine kinase